MQTTPEIRSRPITRNVRVFTTSVAAFLVTWVTPAPAQQTPDLRDRLDAIAGAEVRAERSAGIVAKAATSRETLLHGAYGISDTQTGEAMSVDTIVSIGSITKQFTAAAILRLRDREKLTLDDEVTKWLPDFQTHGNTVTLRHLLGHTSGVADLAAMPELRKLRVMRNPDVTREAIYQIINEHPFEFPTGTMQAYSNTGYWLLGRIIEKVSGQSYEQFLERELLAPLGMARTRYGSSAEALPRCAAGHGMRDGAFRRIPRIVHNGTFAAGALHSTVDDMVAWLTALHTGKVLSASSYADMIAPTCLNDGTPTRYGMGLVIMEDQHGHPFLGHGGGGFGFSSVARWYSGSELAVVVLTNSEPDTISSIADDIADAVLPKSPVVGTCPSDTSILAGKYRGPGRRAGTEVIVEVTQLASNLAVSVDGAAPEVLHWMREWTFRSKDSVILFRRDGDEGRVRELRLDTAGDHFVLTRP